MDEITRKRLAKPGPSDSWTPVECLQAAIDDIERGEIRCQRVILIMIDEPPSGGMEIHPYKAHVRWAEMFGYVHMFLALQYRKWMGGE